MGNAFLKIATTPSVLAAQAANGSAGLYDKVGGQRPSDRFGAAEAAFIADRDSFYMASISESGWPYVQHRGGPPGFLKLLDDTTLADLPRPVEVVPTDGASLVKALRG